MHIISFPIHVIGQKEQVLSVSLLCVHVSMYERNPRGAFKYKRKKI
jgi:hypothetical protein